MGGSKYAMSGVVVNVVFLLLYHLNSFVLLKISHLGEMSEGQRGALAQFRPYRLRLSLVAWLLEQGEHILLVSLYTWLVEGIDAE